MEFEKVKVGMGELEFEKRGEVFVVPNYEDDPYGDYSTIEEYIENEIVPKLDEIKEAKILRIAEWPDMWETREGIDKLLEYMIENEEIFSEIEELQVGLAEEGDIELCTIIQGDYSRFLDTFENIKKLVIVAGSEHKAASNPIFSGPINHENLEAIEIISSRLDKRAIRAIADGYLPSLKSLVLHLGYDRGDEYDIEREDMVDLLESENLEGIERLGFVTDHYQEVVSRLFEEGYINGLDNLKRLDLINCIHTDEEGEILLNNSEQVEKIDEININILELDMGILREIEEKYENIKFENYYYYYTEGDELAYYDEDVEDIEEEMEGE